MTELMTELFLDTVSINILLLVLVAVVTIWYGVKVVPQSQVYIVERFGRYTRTLNAGLSLIVPFLDQVAHRVSILERQLPAFRISVITRDNVEVELETTVFFRIREADKSVYRIRDVELAIHTAATSIVRSAAGKQELDELQSARQQMNEEIQNNPSGRGGSLGRRSYQDRDCRRRGRRGNAQGPAQAVGGGAREAGHHRPGRW